MSEMPVFDLKRLSGKLEVDAIAAVTAAGLECRVIHVGADEWHTSDQRLHRVNLLVQDDVVQSAHFG